MSNKIVQKRRILPSVERLRKLLTYNAITGDLVWAARCWAGKKAGSPSGEGYSKVCIDNVLYLVHRVCWKLYTGDEPPDYIDHIDDNKENNAWTNFRPATNSQNVANAGVNSANTSGFKGVHFSRGIGKWIARIGHQNKRYHLGVFSDKAAACAVYERAAIRLHGEFARVQ